MKPKLRMGYRIVVCATAGAAALAAMPAFADHEPGRRAGSARHVSYDYARVVEVKPIVREVRVETPVRECWEEQRYREYDGGRHGAGVSASAGGTIAGGIIGGVLGHQIGGGSGRDAMTLLGTLVGAAIGGDSGRHREHAGGSHGYSTESYPVERCDVRYQTEVEERIDGYHVTYVYNGQQLTTRTSYDPGNRIRVRVQVQPVG